MRQVIQTKQKLLKMESQSVWKGYLQDLNKTWSLWQWYPLLDIEDWLLRPSSSDWFPDVNVTNCSADGDAIIDDVTENDTLDTKVLAFLQRACCQNCSFHDDCTWNYLPHMCQVGHVFSSLSGPL